MISRDLSNLGLAFFVRTTRVDGADLVIAAEPVDSFEAVERLVRRVRAIHQPIEIPDLRDEPVWLDEAWAARNGVRGVVATAEGPEVLVMGFREPISRVPEGILQGFGDLLRRATNPEPVPSGAAEDVWLGASPIHHAAMRRLELAENTDARVWIEGEAGTGRHRMAKAITTARGGRWGDHIAGSPLPDAAVIVAEPGALDALDETTRLTAAELTIRIAPLRERPEDIDAMVDAWAPGLSEEERAWLRRQPWPGNVPELRWMLWRRTRMQMPLPATQILSEHALRELERKNLEAALEACDGKIYGDEGAARLLGIAGSTFASRLKSFGLR